MFVIWGFGSRRKYTDVLVKDTCDACGTQQNMNILMDYGCFTLFFIPVIKFGKKYYEVCPHCGAGRQLTKKEFKAIKAASKKGLVYETKDITVKKEPEIVLELESKAEAKETSVQNNEIKQEIDRIIEKLKEKNYELTADKIARFKPVLKEQLMKKFANEKEVDAVIEAYFKNI